MLVIVEIDVSHIATDFVDKGLDRCRFTARSHYRQILAMILLSSRRPDSAIISVFTCLVSIPHSCPSMEFYGDTLEHAQFLLGIVGTVLSTLSSSLHRFYGIIS